MFKRHIGQELIDNMQRDTLYQSHLRRDILSGSVFAAIRDRRIDFYYKGGKLFEYDGWNFKTHIKYAAVLDDPDHEYISEADITDKHFISQFSVGYKRIKENCSNYSGVEALGVSSIYMRHSYIKDNLDVVVLDIETSLKSANGDRRQDRIDILLFDKKNFTLKFVEAKHFSNSEIWAKVGSRPKVVDQVNRYEMQLQGKSEEILTAYKEYVNTINKIFSLALPIPQSLVKTVTLVIFGFDQDQKSGRLQKQIIQNIGMKGIKLYCKGDIASIKMSSLLK